MTIKENLKKVVPPSSATINARLDKLNTKVDRIEELEEKLRDLDVIEKKLEQLDTLEKKLGQLDTLEKKLGQLDTLEKKLGQLDTLEKKLGQLDTLETKLGQLDILETKLGQLDTLEKKLGQLDTLEKKLGQLDTLEKKSEQISNEIINKPVLWNSPFEKNMVSNNWNNIWNSEEFEEKYLKLINGLDPNSIQIINDILIRQKKYIGSETESINLFTRDEQEQIRLLRENLNEKILTISDSLYAYKKYLLPINHFESSVFYYKHGINELTCRDFVKGKTILDVGGFIGDSVLVLSELEPFQIITFEADPQNFEILKKTISINHITNVIAENVALGAERRTMTMHSSGSMGTLIDRPGIVYQDIEVKVMPLDEYIKEHPMEIGLIKVDIEGGEPGFLEGAKKTIIEQRPTILLSIYHNAHDFFELKPMIESWNLGYKFKIHKPVFGNVTSETLLICEQ